MENNILKLTEDNDIEGVRKAIAEGVDINLQTKSEGWTALMKASKKGYTEIVKLLIDKGAKLDIQTKHGWTALKVASFYNRIDIAKDKRNNSQDKWEEIIKLLTTNL